MSRRMIAAAALLTALAGANPDSLTSPAAAPPVPTPAAGTYQLRVTSFEGVKIMNLHLKPPSV